MYVYKHKCIFVDSVPRRREIRDDVEAANYSKL